MATHKLDIPAVIHFLGGPKRIEADMRRLELVDPVTFKTAQKWRERVRLPFKRFLQLMVLAEAQGKRLEIRNFLKRS